MITDMQDTPTKWYADRTPRELYRFAWREAKRYYRAGASLKAIDQIAEGYPEYMRPVIEQFKDNLGKLPETPLRRALDFRQYCLSQTIRYGGTNASGFAAYGHTYRILATYTEGVCIVTTTRLS